MQTEGLAVRMRGLAIVRSTGDAERGAHELCVDVRGVLAMDLVRYYAYSRFPLQGKIPIIYESLGLCRASLLTRLLKLLHARLTMEVRM